MFSAKRYLRNTFSRQKMDQSPEGAGTGSLKYKSVLATYRPAYGAIRVAIAQEATGPQYFFCTDSNASVVEILEAFADRAAIEQDFHDLKVIWGVGKQQLRHLWANIGAYHLCLWMHALVELWAWNKSKAEISVYSYLQITELTRCTATR